MAEDEMVITVCEHGKEPERVVLKGPEIAGLKRSLSETKKSGFWCECGNQETGQIIPRGHSVDVLCKNCDAYLQVG